MGLKSYRELSDFMYKKRDALAAMSNDQVLEEVIDAAQGDDYEGSFTTKGQLYYDLCLMEISKRLKAINWLQTFRLDTSMDDIWATINESLQYQDYQDV